MHGLTTREVAERGTFVPGAISGCRRVCTECLVVYAPDLIVYPSAGCSPPVGTELAVDPANFFHALALALRDPAIRARYAYDVRRTDDGAWIEMLRRKIP